MPTKTVRTLSIVLLLSICGVVALTAQTPAPASPPGKPLRHLEYSFNVAVQALQTSKVAGTNGAQTANIAGNLVSPEAGSGSMFVDVLSVAPDGALVVRISELVQNETRPAASVYLQRLREHFGFLPIDGDSKPD